MKVLEGTDSWFPRLVEGLEEARSAAPNRDRYEILGKVGEGAAAIVYRAHDRVLKRTVAIKVLRTGAAESETARRRMHREAEILGGLAHPNLVRLHDAWQEDDGFRLVMEFVEGTTLAAILAHRRSDFRTLIGLVEKAAQGVEAAHAKGVVHRDLKPANILVSHEGVPKVADFGLARVVLTERTRLTATDAVMGTPLYMSPEQVRGGKVGPASDVYALGAILYEAVTGRPPHMGESLSVIFRKILEEEPLAPRKVESGIARSLEAVLLKAMHKMPERRYAHAGEFADDLGRFLRGEAVRARPPGAIERLTRWARRRTKAVAGAALVLAVLSTGAAVKLAERGRAASRLREARDAERRGDFRAAGLKYAAVPGAEGKAAEMERVARAFERRREAEELASRADIAGQEARRAEAEWSESSVRFLGCRESLEPWASLEDHLRVWDLERKVVDARSRMDRHLEDQRGMLLNAVLLDPDNAILRGKMARFYFEKYLRLEEELGPSQRSELRRLVFEFDVEGLASRLDPYGTVSLDCEPGGGEAFLYRYEEGRDTRLIPFPFHAASGEILRNDVIAAGITLIESDFNRVTLPIRSCRLPAGSYLVLLRKAGFADVRVPIFLRRDSRWTGTIRMRRASEIGDGFTFVPGGRFLANRVIGGHTTVDGDEVTVPDFCIGTYEVTMGEYREFLADLARRSREEARRRVPRSPVNNLRFFEVDEAGEIVVPQDYNPRFPVAGVSWEDAVAYCEWRTAKARAVGESVRYRLPSGLEWEKAARGVDGRAFPWGRRFYYLFAKGKRSREGVSHLEVVGSFPQDESVYGVRDMAGSVLELCRDVAQEDRDWRELRGGSWETSAESEFKACATRFGPKDLALVRQGFRLVREP